MDKSRLNEILGILLEKDNSVETADLLNELRNGYQDTDSLNQSLAESEQKYRTLEQKYIDTFRTTLNSQESTTQQTQVTQTVEPAEATTTFEDIFK